MKLDLINITKKYGDFIVNDMINISFKPGITALLGENGAGKTTLMKSIVSIIKPTSGEILLNGEDIIKNEDHYRNLIGYLPQEFNGYPHLNAYEFLYYIGRLKGVSDEKLQVKIKEVLEIANLTEVATKKIKLFSGGMKRRLGIAQSILNDPQILILDEPTVGLDPKERIKFRNIISKIGLETIIILSTHIVSDIENISNQIVIMSKGKVMHDGTKEEICNLYKNKVWEFKVSQDELHQYENQNFKVDDSGNIVLRVISDKKPNECAHIVNVNLEDVFFLHN